MEKYKQQRPLRRIAQTVGRLFCMRELSPVSDHFQHPLDDVFDTPPYQKQDFGWDSEGTYLERE